MGVDSSRIRLWSSYSYSVSQRQLKEHNGGTYSSCSFSQKDCIIVVRVNSWRNGREYGVGKESEISKDQPPLHTGSSFQISI